MDAEGARALARRIEAEKRRRAGPDVPAEEPEPGAGVVQIQLRPKPRSGRVFLYVRDGDGRLRRISR